MKLDKKDRIFTKKLLDTLDDRQLKYILKWIDKPIGELMAASDKKNSPNLIVMEGLVIALLIKRLKAGK